MQNLATRVQRNLSEDSSGSDGGSEVSMDPETDRFGFILTSKCTAGMVGPSPELVRHREAKWIDIISQWERHLYKKGSKVKLQCQKGIPSSLRAKCWPLLCGATNRMKLNKDHYKLLDSQPAQQSWVEVIERDLDRQFPFHEMFLAKDGHGQRGLFRVLKAYTQHQPKEGYCQAQGPVAAVLLMNMPAEEAFWCLVQISEQYLPGYYSPLLEGVLFDAAMLNWVLKRSCPAAHRHLQHFGVEPLMFATDWLMCLFTRHLPFNTLLRVWDLFFCYGVRVLFQVAVVLVRLVLGRAEQRKQCQGQMETLERLRGVREQIRLDDETFITEVCSVPLSSRDLEKQTEKELKSWRKDRPSSTFDPRGRCHGYQVVWARAHENEENRERQEREKGNLSVPLQRSTSTLSLSPSLLRKRWRKGGKGTTGEWEGSGRGVRQLSVGAMDSDWVSWTDSHLKKVQHNEEEEDKRRTKQSGANLKKLIEHNIYPDKPQTELTKSISTMRKRSECRGSDGNQSLGKVAHEQGRAFAECVTTPKSSQTPARMAQDAVKNVTTQHEDEVKSQMESSESTSAGETDSQQRGTDTYQSLEPSAEDGINDQEFSHSPAKLIENADKDATTHHVEEVEAQGEVTESTNAERKETHRTEEKRGQDIEVQEQIGICEEGSAMEAKLNPNKPVVDSLQSVMTQHEEEAEHVEPMESQNAESKGNPEGGTDGSQGLIYKAVNEQSEISTEGGALEAQLSQSPAELVADTVQNLSMGTDGGQALDEVVPQETGVSTEGGAADTGQSHSPVKPVNTALQEENHDSHVQEEQSQEITDSETEVKDTEEETSTEVVGREDLPALEAETEIKRDAASDTNEDAVIILHTPDKLMTDVGMKTEEIVETENMQLLEIDRVDDETQTETETSPGSKTDVDTQVTDVLDTKPESETREGIAKIERGGDEESSKPQREPTHPEDTEDNKATSAENDAETNIQIETEIIERSHDDVDGNVGIEGKHQTEVKTDTEENLFDVTQTKAEAEEAAFMDDIQQIHTDSIAPHLKLQIKTPNTTESSEQVCETVPITTAPTEEQQGVEAEFVVSDSRLCDHEAAAEETQTQARPQSAPSDSETCRQKVQAEPDRKKAECVKPPPEQPMGVVSANNSEEKMVNNLHELARDESIFLLASEIPQLMNSHVQGSGRRGSSGEFCVRRSSTSRGSRTARRLSDDLFTAPLVATAPNSAELSPKPQQEIMLSQTEGEPEHSTTAKTKRFFLFRRRRGTTTKQTKVLTVQVPKILIQDFSDGVRMMSPVEEEEQKLSSKERRRRRREEERRVKEEERLRKKREKEVEEKGKKEQERRKPQTRGKSFQVRAESQAHSSGPQERRNSAPYADSYF